MSRRARDEAFQDEVLSKLRRLGVKMNSLTWKVYAMSKELDDLATEVAEIKTVAESAVVTITNLAQMVRDAGTDATKLKALAADLDASAKSLGDAIVAGTPAAPTPVEPQPT